MSCSEGSLLCLLARVAMVSLPAFQRSIVGTTTPRNDPGHRAWGPDADRSDGDD